MGVPYETKPIAGIAITGSSARTIMVPFPSRAYINKVIVKQTAGGADGFKLELFNHKDALGEGSPSVDEDGNPIPLDCYRICNLISVGNQTLYAYFSEETNGGTGMLFVCQDVEPTRRGQRMRNLYIRITPNGSGAKTFAVCVGGDAEVA